MSPASFNISFLSTASVCFPTRPHEVMQEVPLPTALVRSGSKRGHRPEKSYPPPGWTHRILSRNTLNQRLGFPFGESILLSSQQDKREKRFETSPSEPSRWPSTRSIFGAMRERCTSSVVGGDGSKRLYAYPRDPTSKSELQACLDVVTRVRIMYVPGFPSFVNR